jgi:hypothetical protein
LRAEVTRSRQEGERRLLLKGPSMRQRAFIHVAGPAGAGKTTFVEALLRGLDEPVICVRGERDAALADPAVCSQTRAKMRRELRKLRAAGPPKPTEHWALAPRYKGLERARLRFLFTSDGGWSDQDGLWLTSYGGVQVDWTEVFGSTRENFTDGTGGWVPPRRLAPASRVRARGGAWPPVLAELPRRIGRARLVGGTRKTASIVGRIRRPAVGQETAHGVGRHLRLPFPPARRRRREQRAALPCNYSSISRAAPSLFT